MQTISSIVERVARLEAFRGPEALEIRPILPDDMGLQSWVWTKNNVVLRPAAHLAICGVQCARLISVRLHRRLAFGNVVALLATGQPLYEPYWWHKLEDMAVEFASWEGSPADLGITFSVLGFVIEPKGMTIAV